MLITTPDQVLLKILWDLRIANGRSPQIALTELATRVNELQQAGVSVYGTKQLDELQDWLVEDVANLESLGLLRRRDRYAAELTGAGEVLASTLEYPEWVRVQVGATVTESSRPRASASSGAAAAR
jgi:hypothetical protein